VLTTKNLFNNIDTSFFISAN